ncbi:hypothetical protein ACLOJK_003803 [Asimina triloba]
MIPSLLLSPRFVGIILATRRFSTKRGLCDRLFDLEHNRHRWDSPLHDPFEEEIIIQENTLANEDPWPEQEIGDQGEDEMEKVIKSELDIADEVPIEDHRMPPEQRVPFDNQDHNMEQPINEENPGNEPDEIPEANPDNED